MNKILPILLVAILTTGCSTFTPKAKVIQIEKRVQPVEVLHPPLPDALVWEEVEYTILTVEIMREIVIKVDSGEISERDAVFFAVSPDGYEHLALNMAEMKRLIEGQKSVIFYYKTTVPDMIFLPEE
jgi:hypothetical protein